MNWNLAGILVNSFFMALICVMERREKKLRQELGDVQFQNGAFCGALVIKCHPDLDSDEFIAEARVARQMRPDTYLALQETKQRGRG